MGTVPTVPTFVAAATLTASQLNQIRDVWDFQKSVPSCSAYHSTLVSLTNATFTLIALQSETFDNVQSGDSPSHDNSTNNSRIVCRTNGKYEITGLFGVSANATGIRAADIRLNAAGNPASGTSIMAPQVAALAGGFTTVVPIPVIVVQLTAGDYIEMFGYQNSGGAINSATGSNTSFLRFKWVGI